MKEFNKLLTYIDYYVYSYKKECITIKNGAFEEQAKEIYHKINSEFFYQNNTWYLDIALDCIRIMSSSDREKMRHDLCAYKYHFGLGLYIRNRYFSYARKKHHKGIMSFADDASFSVILIIFTILHPIFDWRNTKLVFFCNFSLYTTMYTEYGEQHQDIFDNVIAKFAKEENNMSSEEALELIRSALRDVVEKDEFKRILIRCAKYWKSKKSLNKDILWINPLLGNDACLFPKERNYISELSKTTLFSDIMNNKIKDIEQCKKCIEAYLCLSKDDSEFLTECVWEAYHG